MDGETGQGAPYWPYTFNACAVEVQVDTLTGRVEVLDAVFAQDVSSAKTGAAHSNIANPTISARNLFFMSYPSMQIGRAHV